MPPPFDDFDDPLNPNPTDIPPNDGHYFDDDGVFRNPDGSRSIFDDVDE